MSKKNRFSLSKFLFSLLGVIPAIFSLTTYFVTIIGMEVRSVGKTITSILILAILSIIFLASVWCGILALLFIYFTTSLLWSASLSIFVLILINILFLLIVAFILSNLKKKLGFPATRKLLRHALRQD